MHRFFAKAVAALSAAAGLALVGGPAFAAAPTAYTCTGGDIPSGTYGSITVAGFCSVADGAVITVTGNLTVRAGASLDAQSAPATITVNGNVWAGAGSMLGLGCLPDGVHTGHPCAADPNGRSTILVKGNVTTSGAAMVPLSGIEVRGNVSVTGGGSPQIPWSIEHSTIRGNLQVSHLTTNWLGVVFNLVGGNVLLSNVTITEEHPGAEHVVYVGHNVIMGNLACANIVEGVSGGFPPGSKNTVAGNATGQCADIAQKP